MCVSRSVISDSLWPCELYPTRVLCPWTSSVKSGLPFPFQRDLPNPGIELRSAALQVDSLPSGPPGKPLAGITKSANDRNCIQTSVCFPPLSAPSFIYLTNVYWMLVIFQALFRAMNLENAISGQISRTCNPLFLPWTTSNSGILFDSGHESRFWH